MLVLKREFFVDLGRNGAEALDEVFDFGKVADIRDKNISFEVFFEKFIKFVFEAPQSFPFCFKLEISITVVLWLT